MNVRDFRKPQSFYRSIARRELLDNSLFVVDMKKAIESYILNCTVEEKSKLTVASYEHSLKRFLWWLEENNLPTSMGEITADHIRHFMVYLKEPNRWKKVSTSSRRPAGTSTINKYYRALKTFFNWAKTEHFVQNNPLSNIKSPKLLKPEIPIYSPNELKALISQCLTHF